MLKNLIKETLKCQHFERDYEGRWIELSNKCGGDSSFQCNERIILSLIETEKLKESRFKAKRERSSGF